MNFTDLDPRHKNTKINATSVKDYVLQYTSLLSKAIEMVDFQEVESAYKLIQETIIQDGQIYVAGNGGSSAIANHFCCDFVKGTHVHHLPALRVHSLVSNTSLFSALANDMCYEKSLSLQVEMICRPGDLLIVISSSGNSPNIIEALMAARAKGMKTIAFTGFKGGKAKDMADAHIHVEVSNYGICEDAHQVFMHALSQHLVRARELALSKV